jgi:hypothetical protein
VITARAIGVLEEILVSTPRGGAKALSEVLGEGRDALQSAITELKEVGYLETVKNRLANGSVHSTLQITEAGHQFLVSRCHILLTQLNSNLILDTNSYKLLTKSTEQVREDYENVVDIKLGDKAPMDDSFPDYEDLDGYRDKLRQKKRDEYVAQKQAHAETKLIHRGDTAKSKWSPTDTTYEFAYRIKMSRWDIAPWRVGNSRFAFALANFRKQYDTDGELECILMDMFFDSIQHETSLKDPEMMWKMFIKRAPGMVEQARLRLYSTEVMQEEQESANSTWEGF